MADREKILETLDNDNCQVLVIRGETGSGKTTCVPQAGFQIDTCSSASDWLIFNKHEFDWLIMSTSQHSFENPIQFILDHFANQMKKCKIWVTQPRKIAARTVSMRVAERDIYWEKGVRSDCETKDGQEVDPEKSPSFPSIVGYHVGLDKCTHKDSRIIYMTPGEKFFRRSDE